MASSSSTGEEAAEFVPSLNPDLVLVPIPPVVTTSTKVTINNPVGIGDCEDILVDKILPNIGGTVHSTINTRRSFLPGNYEAHILQVNSKTKENVVIICLDTVDPLKIHSKLNGSNVGEDWKCLNYINRYDWMLFANYGTEISELKAKEKQKFHSIIKKKFGEKINEDYLRFIRELSESHISEVSDSEEIDEDGSGGGGTKKEDSNSKGSEDSEASTSSSFDDEEWECEPVTFFVNSDYNSKLLSGDFEIERDNELINLIKEKETGIPIGFIIEGRKKDANEYKIIPDYFYGCVLVDKNTGKCFGFVMENAYTVRIHYWYNMDNEEFKQRENIGTAGTNYTYDVNELLR